ncbi:MAG: hypothetical protein DRN15_10490 [Thermoprotei archaeon]|nr:MAG: hypothetical protein DRN15_10490 [Thermoprotei archaeon]
MVKGCPECGGELKFDPRRKLYVCLNCGLTLTREEYFMVREEIKRLIYQETEDEKEKWRREYLKWWLSSKKEE